MRVCIISWVGHNNIGDEAYGVAFPLVFPGCDVVFRGRCSPGDDFDVYVLGGGDIVLPAYTRSFTPEQNARCVAASVTVTRSSDFEFLRRCRRVIVRDAGSRDLCMEQGVEAEVVPDLAFLLRPDRARGRAWVEERFARERKDLYSRLVCCTPNGYTFFGRPDSKSRDFNKALSVADDLAWICDETNASVLFLPFGTRLPADDRTPSSFIASRTKWQQKHLVVYDRLDVQTTLDVIAACDAMVGNRLHALIFATIAATPFVALRHHAKISNFVEDLGRPDWGHDFYDVSRHAVLSLLRRHLEDDAARSYLRTYSDAARSIILARPLP